jgi:hypothetical protein
MDNIKAGAVMSRAQKAIRRAKQLLNIELVDEGRRPADTY